MTKIGSKLIDGENQVNPSDIEGVDIKPSNVMPGNPANDVPQMESYETSIQGPPGNDGADGTGISSISRTSGDGSPGTTDTYTITYTDGATSTFTLYNGDNGTPVELQAGTTYLQWRYVGDTTWTNLIALTELIGPKGDVGDAPDMQVTSGMLQYSKDGGTTWIDLYDLTTLNGIKGVDGYSIITHSTTASIDDALFTSLAGRVPMDGDAIINTNNGDNILWQRETGVWVDKGTINGANGATPKKGVDYFDGVDGNKWYHGTSGPAIDVGTGVAIYGEYYVHTTNKTVHYKAPESTIWSILFTMNGSIYKASISKTIDLSAVTINSSLSISVTGLAYSAGQFAVVANSDSNFLIGKVSSYDGSVLNMTVVDKTGIGSFSSWTLNLGAKPNVAASKRGAAYQVFLPAADGSVAGRIADAGAVFPEGWIASDDAGDLVLNHNVTDDGGIYRPAFVVEVMYKRSTDSHWVTLQGAGAYSSKENDLINGQAILNSLTTNQVDIKIHLMFY